MHCDHTGSPSNGDVSLLQVEVSKTQIVVGMLLIVLSQAVQAGQITFEDYFLSNTDVSPMKIVGYEGLWGLIMITVLLLLATVMPGTHRNAVCILACVRLMHKRSPLLDFLVCNDDSLDYDALRAS